MISIIIPVFNEEANLAWHHEKISRVPRDSCHTSLRSST